jgi:non-heme chloroperoxidase
MLLLQDLNVRPIARTCQVITYDLRFHGDSGKPSWGFHVSRLAADLRDLLDELNLQEVTVVGSSMGAAVIWSYWELYGAHRLAQAVFVDQAPLQNVTADWKAGSTGCFDIASLTRLQCRLISDFAGFSHDNAKFCASPVVPDDVLKVLEQETLRADPAALAALMADHTALDWRPLLPRITIPCLNIVGRRSAVFPYWGCQEVSRLIPNSHCVFFEDSNHWLYIEQPARFSQLVAAFAVHGFKGVQTVLHVR